LRKIVEDAARRNPPRGTNFDLRFGKGRVSGATSVQAAMMLGNPNATGLQKRKISAAKKRPSSRKTTGSELPLSAKRS